MPEPFVPLIDTTPGPPAFAPSHGAGTAARPPRAAFPMPRTATVAGFDPSGSAAIPDVLLATARRQAVEEGYRVGLREGLAEAERRAAEELAEAREALAVAGREAALRVESMLAALTVAADALERERHAEAVDHTAQVLDAVAHLTEAVLGHGLRRGEDTALDALDRALRPMPGDAPVTVALHPADLEVAEAALAGAAPRRDVTLVADSSLRRGDAVARCGVTEVDARLKGALDRALGALTA